MNSHSFRDTWTHFTASERGSAAIEFAVVAPVMLVLLLGTFEISKFIQTNNQVVQTVSMVGQMASQLPATATISDVQRIWSAAPLIAPESLRTAAHFDAKNWSDVLSVTITSIAFEKRVATCDRDCDYDAKVAWSVGQFPLSCSTIFSTTSGNENTIPPEFYNDTGSVLSVRSSLPYRPHIVGTANLLADLSTRLNTNITEASWFMPREAPRIVLAGSSASNPNYTLCPEVNR